MKGDKPYKMEMVLDHSIYPESEVDDVLDWTDFAVPFDSLDRELGYILPDICE